MLKVNEITSDASLNIYNPCNFIEIPTIPTAASGDSSYQCANTAFIHEILGPTGATGAIQFTDGNRHLNSDASFNYVNQPSVKATGTLTYALTIVSGTNTLFLDELKRDQELILFDNTNLGKINMIIDQTHLTLVSNSLINLTPQFFYTSQFNVFTTNGDFIPSETNTYSLGNSSRYWANLHIGPGTINIVGEFEGVKQSAEIGLNQNGVVFFNTGAAAPYYVIGPTIDPLAPAIHGGWILTAIGDTGPTGVATDLVVQTQVGGTGTGPILSLLSTIG